MKLLEQLRLYLCCFVSCIAFSAYLCSLTRYSSSKCLQLPSDHSWLFTQGARLEVIFKKYLSDWGQTDSVRNPFTAPPADSSAHDGSILWDDIWLHPGAKVHISQSVCFVPAGGLRVFDHRPKGQDYSFLLPRQYVFSFVKVGYGGKMHLRLIS